MTSYGRDSVTGKPLFRDSDAPDIKQDPQEAADYAAEVGNRLIGTTAQRVAYAYAREGLRWYDTTTKLEYEHDGSGWQPVGASNPHFGYRKTGAFQWSTTATDHTWDTAPFEGVLAGFSTTDRVTFTCTKPGVYALLGSLTSNTGSSTTDINVIKNGVVIGTFNGRADASSYMSQRFAFTSRFAVGDTFKIQLVGSGITAGVPGAQSFITVDMLHT